MFLNDLKNHLKNLTSQWLASKMQISPKQALRAIEVKHVGFKQKYSLCGSVLG